jgi:hypothetical protein
MKKNFCKLLFLLGISYNLLAMEAAKPKTIKDKVPIELFNYILSYISDDPVRLVEYLNSENNFQDDGICHVAVPQTIAGKNSHEAKLSLCDQWVPSTNLNPCEIVPEGKNSKKLLFNVQCWKKPASGSSSYSSRNDHQWTEYRIDDDKNENRFMGSISFKARDTFFDGPNNDNYILFAANRKLKNNENLKKTNNKAEENREEYQYVLGKFTDDGHQRHKKNIYDLRNGNELKYRPQPIDGTLTAIALCKTENRYALVDNNGFVIFELSKEDPALKHASEKNDPRRPFEELKPDIIGLCTMHLADTFKKVCFITPSILFGITTLGKLYRIDLIKEQITVALFEQTLKTKQGQKITLRNFAVDPCYPYHILLHTSKNDILYWDLNKYKKPELGKEFVSLWKNKNADQLWFYNNKICFGTKKKSELHTENYILHVLDLRVQEDKNKLV